MRRREFIAGLAGGRRRGHSQRVRSSPDACGGSAWGATKTILRQSFATLLLGSRSIRTKNVEAQKEMI